jgi:HEAT repeat protein
VAVITPLLQNPDGLIRLQAARVLSPVDPDAARRVLDAALADANPVVRYESAKTLEAVADTHPAAIDLPALRKRLRDRDAHVRLPVASALLKLARSS